MSIHEEHQGHEERKAFERPLILGIETSCDETAVALVDGAMRVHANVIASQTEIHAPYGGVVPELASRAHVERLVPLLDEAWRQAGTVVWDDIDAIAVTRGPGLVGCLLVGVETAKGLSLARKKPLVGVNHLAGHLWSVFLRERDGRSLAKFESNSGPADPGAFEPPFVGLIVSGGHSSLALVRAHDDIETIGQTLDDAAGEAYDKVAKLLGLGYPGGPVIDKLAREYEEKTSGESDGSDSSGRSDSPDPFAHRRGLEAALARWPLPRPMRESPTLDVSFSGLKTAVVRLVEQRGGGEAVAGDPDDARALCAAFQATVVDLLVSRAERALERHSLSRLAVVGGVACNRGLRRALVERLARRGILVALPPPILCTDNAAMIAAVGVLRFRQGRTDALDLNPVASMEF